MAEAAVEFLLGSLTQLLINQAHLIKDARGKVLQLEDDIKFFKFFLKKISGKKRRNEMLNNMVRTIRGVIYDADDIIDAFVTQAADNKSKNYFNKAFRDTTGLLDVAIKVRTILDTITQIYGGKDKYDLINLPINDGEDDEEPLQPTSSRNDNVVGLEDEAAKIVGYLNEKTDYVDVISINGMAGLGKTTLTGKIYHDPNTIYLFPIRIWVYVSQDFKDKEVFLSILRQMKTKLNEDDYGKKNAAQLAEEIANNLEEVKFLLVMDDVWETSDWDRLKVVFPKLNMTGKVIITSRHDTVGRHANHNREPHGLRALNFGESCELLQRTVFGEPKFPSDDLKKVGQAIAGKCQGLPLAIVVIGGVLKANFPRSASQWEIVSKSVTEFLKKDPLNRMERIISMSYEKLPYHMKECFLYLAMFPEDREIPAWKLIRMWIAEGLIQPKGGEISMEETGEYYLNDLINRNLVKVEKSKADGRVKTRRIHDMLRDFCKKEGGKDGDNFLQEIVQTGDGGLQPRVIEGVKHRRICIHSSVLEFLSMKPKGTSVRSFVTFSEDIEMPTEYISAIFAAFKLLRVLEAKPINFGKFPNDFYHLVHLRYLALSLNQDISKPVIISKYFNKLLNMQTLIVDTTSRAIEIKADVMSMTQIRHLKTNASTTFPKPGKDSKEGKKLQTLCTMSPESCTEAIFDRACNLRKLGIRGKIGLFLEGKIGSIDSLKKLAKLDKLKLYNDVFPSPASVGKLASLHPQKFPATLRSLTLVATLLDWTHMSTLASLGELKVLKLKNNAFVGSNWTVTGGGFDSLEVLFIERTDLSIWEASADHFRSLKRLKLENCGKLKQIPIALADIPKFEHLELEHCKEAAASALEIKDKKKDDPTFKFSIVPLVDGKNNV